MGFELARLARGNRACRHRLHIIWGCGTVGALDRLWSVGENCIRRHADR